MKNYVKPMMESEVFAANEYIAACGDSGVVYKFKCDAGDGVPGSVYEETNGIPGLQTSGRNRDREIASYAFGGLIGYHACGTVHEAESDSGFYDGYYCERGNTSNPVSVIIWKGEYNNNVHCTTNLDQDSWETAKS